MLQAQPEPAGQEEQSGKAPRWERQEAEGPPLMVWAERWVRQGQVEQRPLQGALALAPRVRRWPRVAVPPVEQMPLAAVDP